MFDHERGSTFVRFEGNKDMPKTGQVVVVVAGDLNLAIRSAARQARVLLAVPESAIKTRSFGSELFENKLT